MKKNKLALKGSTCMNLIGTAVFLFTFLIQVRISSAQLTPITAPVPVITVSPTYLSFGSVLIGSNSVKQTFNLKGRYLKANLVVTAPIGYNISDNNLMNPPNTKTLTFSPTGGNVDKTIYVEFRPTAERVYLGIVTSSSQGATSKGVNVTGEGILGILTVSPASLAFGDIEVGKSSFMSFSVSGTGLESDLVITAPNGFSITHRKFPFYPYSQTVRIAPDYNKRIQATIGVCFKPTSKGPFVGNITNISSKRQKNVIVSGMGIPPIPVISVFPYSLNFWNVAVGSSKVLSYELKGVDLVGNIEVLPVNNFTVSTKLTGTYSSVLSIPHKKGIVDTIIYVKFIPTNATEWDTHVFNESTKARSVLLKVYGIGKMQSLASSAGAEDNPLVLKSAGVSSVKLFPNPASDQFTILLNQIVPESINVLNWSGRTVLTVDKSLLNNSEIVVQTAQLPKGYYLVNIRTVSTTYSEKLLIEK